MNKVLFIGNGLNTLDSQNKDFSWNDILINKMSPEDKKHFVDPNGKIIKELSPTFIFDAVQQNSGNVDFSEFSKFKNTDSLIKDFVHKFDTIITTNYTSEFEIEGNWKNADASERLYGLFRSRTNGSKKIWYIHGIHSSPNSINMSFKTYTRQISKIQQYMDGRLDSKKYPDVLSMKKRVENKQLSYEKALSWIDYLFCPDTQIDIAGFSLDYSEIDLWYLLELRSKYFSKDNHNKIIFYSRKDNSPAWKTKKHILKTFNIEYKEIDFPAFDREYYKKLLEIL